MKRLKYNAPVVLTYTLISFLALILNNVTNGWTNQNLFSVYRCGFDNVLAFFRLFGHAIGHGNLNHFTNNFVMILLLGPALEEKYGSLKLLFSIVATAVITGIIQCAISSNTALLGASGIVFMMIVMSSCTSFKDGQLPITLLLILVIYLGDQVVAGLSAKDSISQMGHIIGGLCGMGFGLTLSPNKRSAEKTKKYSSEEEKWLKTGKID